MLVYYEQEYLFARISTSLHHIIAGPRCGSHSQRHEILSWFIIDGIERICRLCDDVYIEDE